MPLEIKDTGPPTGEGGRELNADISVLSRAEASHFLSSFPVSLAFS